MSPPLDSRLGNQDNLTSFLLVQKNKRQYGMLSLESHGDMSFLIIYSQNYALTAPRFGFLGLESYS